VRSWCACENPPSPPLLVCQLDGMWPEITLTKAPSLGLLLQVRQKRREEDRGCFFILSPSLCFDRMDSNIIADINSSPVVVDDGYGCCLQNNGRKTRLAVGVL
jgi:hypothetical protein